MGGSVLIGIRRRNGVEYLAQRWTNPTPYWFNDPDFYDEDEHLVQSYIDEPRDDADVARDPKIITPSEYGVILVDLIKRRVLSRQDYTGIGEIHTNFRNIEKLGLVQKLSNLGYVRQISIDRPDRDQTSSPWGEPNADGLIVLDEARQKLYYERVAKELNPDDEDDTVQRDTQFFDIAWEIPGLEVSDITGGRGYNHWPDVLKWVAENGWKTPVMSQEEVNKRYLEL